MTQSAQTARLKDRGLIDRSQSLTFTFDGVPYNGYAGDTLASALLANGVRLVGRSFKYHRPRGILTSGSEEPNALVELRSGARREPNTKATITELYDGLEAKSQNRFPSLSLDLLAINGLVSPFLSAGFYYKTFMWPASFWEKIYEPMIRRAAGLGRAAQEHDPDSYDKAFAFCDVLVVGSGPAGLMAALTAARTGARVILVDESFAFGGRLLSDVRTVGGANGADWVNSVVAELKSFPGVQLMPRTTVFGAYDSGQFGAVERVADHVPVPAAGVPRQRLWRIVAKHTIIAQGALERPIVFGNNDRPGVMLASAVRTYINRFGVKPGETAVVFSNNDDGASTIADLVGAGIRVAALVDTRTVLQPATKSFARKHGIRIFEGAVVADAIGSSRVTGARIVAADGTSQNIACDLIAVSGGFNPSVQVSTHLGGRAQWQQELAAFVPGALPKGMAVSGSAKGTFGLASCLKEGAQAGEAAAVASGFQAKGAAVPAADDEPSDISAFWHVKTAKHKAFVDQQNDVTAADVALAEREGFRSVEHLKRYTTLGMATDQGKTSNVNGLAMLAQLTGKTIAATGATSARPPYTPVSLGALAGEHRGKHFKATRLTPSHDWAKERGAVFIETGMWLRAQYYPKPGENDWLTTVCREVNTVRNSVGVCDVSTLGKIEIHGTDAGKFLDRVYINMMSTLGVGKARYGMMLREDGIAMDDGTAARFADDRYFITTTTANAIKVLQHLELCRQWYWPDLDVQIFPVSDQWAQYSVAGPRARDLLAKIVDAPFDISNAAFPYMAVAELTVMGGVKARLYRLSFSGEMAYEIAVPARQGDRLMRTLMAKGEEFGIAPYGTEALGVMRIEKGHVAGPELNGTTTAADLGLGKMASTKKDFVGRVLSQRPGLTDPTRPRVVGFRPVDRSQRLRGGAHFIGKSDAAVAQNDQGYMTSVAYSPSLGHWIGLGLLANAESRMGEILRAYDPVRNGDVLVEVVPATFVDVEGARLRV
ncbi:sarcosine oxidase subunit alpha family protein [Hyphomicrobium sp.]|uniref:sarcosine oxidase subunit alpha family protein n=1 Tax=Hyphomicrobium sp. TaxID=82 RepID=UPI000FBDF1D9|nr:sarcosine oxidase subunit alpha family protein [Hyphomicrobium sp.]RUP07444.1 MAG: sarcosine oxidase subunit alpha family protein [Hyphomicrobium sp.]